MNILNLLKPKSYMRNITDALFFQPIDYLLRHVILIIGLGTFVSMILFFVQIILASFGIIQEPCSEGINLGIAL